MEHKIELKGFKVSRESIKTTKIVASREIMARSEAEALEIIVKEDFGWSGRMGDSRDETVLSIVDTYSTLENK